jgi:polyisoprenoid-binding protein YceI
MITKKRILLGIVAAGLAGLIAVGGYVAYIYVSGGSGEASVDIGEVVQPAIRPTDTGDAPSPEIEDSPTEVATDEATEEVPATIAPTLSIEDSSTSAETADVRFSIVSEDSEVRFLIGEEYSGVDITVVGKTNQVGGEILVDVANPPNSFIGPITINLRTLETDIELRNRAIRSQILKSAEDEYEFTDFVPTEIIGMPDEVNIGESFSFTVIGDMKLVDVTNTLTFEVTITPLSEDRIEGFATTTIDRRDYNLIDFTPPRQVGGVENEVELQIDFIADRVVE